MSDLSIGLELDDGRIFHAALKTLPGRHWARFRMRKPDGSIEEIMGARLHVVGDAANSPRVCTLQVNNGVLDRDGSGELYWKGIVRFRRLWVDLRTRTGELLVHGLQGGGQEIHLYDGAQGDLPWPQRKPVTVRFAIATRLLNGYQDALALLNRTAEDWWMPIQPDRTFGPAHLPTAVAGDAEAADREHDWTAAQNAYKTGQPNDSINLRWPKIGPWLHPDYPLGMTPGGFGIECYPDRGCHGAVMFAFEMHARWMDRSLDVLYDATGRQITCHTFPAPMHYRGIVEGPCAGGNEITPFLVGPPEHFALRWFNGTAKSGDEAVWQWKKEATSHLTRATRHGKYAYCYTEDPAIREDLVSIFESRRIDDYSDRPDEQVIPPWTGAYINPSLRALHLHASTDQAHAGTNMVDRAAAWMLDIATFVDWTGTDRGEFIDLLLETLERFAMPDCGVISCKPPDKPWIPSSFRVQQWFHNCLIHVKYAEACHHVGRVPTILHDFLAAHFQNAAYPVQAYLYNLGQFGPCWWGALYKDDKRIPLALDTSWSNDQSKPSQKGDVQFTLHLLELGHRADPTRGYRLASLKCYVPHDTIAQREEWIATAPEESFPTNYIGLQRQTLALAHQEPH